MRAARNMQFFISASRVPVKLGTLNFGAKSGLPARFEADQRFGMETVGTVKNKKDPPKQVLLVAASPQPGITRFYPGC